LSLFSHPAQGDPLASFQAFDCSDTGYIRGAITRLHVSHWCPICSDSSSAVQRIPVQSVEFIRSNSSCQLRLNGRLLNTAKLWVYGGFAYWENVLQVVRGFGGGYDETLLKLVPAYIQGAGDPEDADVQWSEPLPDGTTMLAITGKRFGLNFGNERVMMNSPAIYAGKRLLWADSTGDEMLPQRLGSSYDSSISCKFLAYQHVGAGSLTSECGEISVFEACKDGKLKLLGDIQNPKCVSSEDWVVNSLSGALMIRQKVKGKGCASFIADQNGVRSVTASPSKRR